MCMCAFLPRPEADLSPLELVKLEAVGSCWELNLGSGRTVCRPDC